ncbi:hypothetical protein [Candidatus Nitrososphaera evergladensis]|nr:hypothetical protein [Candidatus Nitrososphaera evergladensis]
MIQLWTNLDETEFAIKLASDAIGFRASTSDTADYVKLIDEIHEMDDQQIDWPFMLGKWIASWKDGFRHSALQYGHRTQKSQKDTAHDTLAYFPASNIKQKRKRGKRRRKSRRRKLDVRCRFCNLMFYNDVERATHEKEWHANKLL